MFEKSRVKIQKKLILDWKQMKKKKLEFICKKNSNLFHDEYSRIIKNTSGIGKNDGEGTLREIEEEPHFSNNKIISLDNRSTIVTNKKRNLISF